MENTEETKKIEENVKETKEVTIPEENTIKDNKINNVNNALLLIIGVLIVMSAIQVFQFQKITKLLLNGSVNVSTQTSGSKTALPSQVGGCG